MSEIVSRLYKLAARFVCSHDDTPEAEQCIRCEAATGLKQAIDEIKRLQAKVQRLDELLIEMKTVSDLAWLNNEFTVLELCSSFIAQAEGRCDEKW